MDKRSDAIIEKYAAPFVQIVLEKNQQRDVFRELSQIKGIFEETRLADFLSHIGVSQAEKSKIDKMVLENKKADAQRKLQLNLANNQTNYDIALAQIELKDKARKIAKNALDQVEKEFRYGVKKSMDLIDAENDLEKAELEYKTAVFNQRRAAIELMKSTQNLDVEKF